MSDSVKSHMGADESLAAHLATLPVPEFPSTELAKPPALADARVGVVTTAALHHADDPGWEPGEQSFRVIDGRRRDDLVLGHLSPNFDRTGVVMDRNVVLPIDRLDELAARGIIGSVSPFHISFLGAQDETMSTIRVDSGPAAAKRLLEAGVDVVLLTPV